MIKFILIYFIILTNITLSFAQAPGCPSVTISAPGAVGGQLTLACNQDVTLTANVFHTGTTNTYTVTSIPYAPPYPFNTGTPILVNQDDVWSGIINLPFTFCFFGNSYNRLVAGSNGVVSFDLSYASQLCAWSFNASIPSTSLFRNTIFGPYHDIDPAVSGTMYYAVLGSYPCRTFVVNWFNVAMFSSACNALKATHQIVIYETTNVIEVYIQNAPLCTSWNNGNKVIGIQNATGTVGFTPPGRNTGPWQTSNEAWRFTPNGPQNYTLQWYQGTTPIGTTNSINVCPTSSPTIYRAIVTYDNCDLSQVVVQAQLTVTLSGLNVTAQATPSIICNGGSSQLQVNFAGAGSACVPNSFSYQWSPSATLSSSNVQNPIATPTTTTQYTVTVSHNNLNCSGTASVTVNVESPPIITATASPLEICSGSSSTISASGAQQYNWSGLGSGASQVVSPTTTTTYTVTGTSANGCTNTANITVTVYPSHLINILASQTEICEGDSVLLWLDNPINPIWSTGQNDNSIIVKPTTTTTYSVIDINQYGCTDSNSIIIFVNQNPIVDFTASPKEGCPPFQALFQSQVISEDPITNYLWNVQSQGTFNIENPQYYFQHSGYYDVSLQVKTIKNCLGFISKHQYIHVYPKPTINFTYSPSHPEVETAVYFNDLTTGASQWQWNFGDGFSSDDPNPVHVYNEVGNYLVSLTVSNSFGCSEEASQTIYVRDIATLYMPNSFSPDANGFNDYFGPKGMNIERMKFYIYNRWGHLVFYTEDINHLWDGKVNGELPSKSEVFTWKLEVKFVDGFVKHLMGQVYLLR